MSKMKLRNKKTGETIDIKDALWESDDYPNHYTISDDWEEVPEKPKKYWFIDVDGKPIEEDYDSQFDRDCRSIGNYFETKEEAGKAVEKLNAWKRLKDKRFRFVGWYDSVSDNDPDVALFKLDEDAWGTDTCEDLDLLFDSSVDIEQKPKIISKLAKVEIAPEDYREGDKDLFTWEEAMEAARKDGDGWRLPTKDEWGLIDKEFANGDSRKIQKKLGLALGGFFWASPNTSGRVNQGSYGLYWSSTVRSDDYTYGYYLDTSDTDPQDYFNKYYGYSVRLVRDLEEK